jgi:hypothetical protein
MGASRVDLKREAVKSVVHLMRDAISDHPWPSRANQRSSEVSPRSSEVIRGHQRSSVVIRGHQRSVRGHQRSSEVIRGHPRSSEVIRDQSEVLSVPGWRYATGSAES